MLEGRADNQHIKASGGGMVRLSKIRNRSRRNNENRNPPSHREMKPLEGKNLVKVGEITLNQLKKKAQAKHMLSIWKLKLKIEL